MSIKDYKLGRGGTPDSELNKNINNDLVELLSSISENPGEIPPSDIISKLELIQNDMKKLSSFPSHDIISKLELIQNDIEG